MSGIGIETNGLSDTHLHTHSHTQTHTYSYIER